jgi:hypothetical protein
MGTKADAVWVALIGQDEGSMVVRGVFAGRSAAERFASALEPWREWSEPEERPAATSWRASGMARSKTVQLWVVDDD